MNKKPNHVLDNVEGFCGPYPSDFIDIDISNDPSFIFQNDIRAKEDFARLKTRLRMFLQ